MKKSIILLFILFSLDLWSGEPVAVRTSTFIDKSYNGKLITNLGATVDVTYTLDRPENLGSKFTVSFVNEVTGKSVSILSNILDTLPGTSVAGNSLKSSAVGDYIGFKATSKWVVTNTSPSVASWVDTTIVPPEPEQIANYVATGWTGSGAGNTLAYSMNGADWVGLGKTIFTFSGWCVAYNGSIFVAGGSGTNSLAYSYDGINWTGCGQGVLGSCYTICWNGSIFVAGGSGSGTTVIAYSSDGKSWTASPTTVFGSTSNGANVNRISWNGTRFIAGANAPSSNLPNTIGYSTDGITWYGEGKPVFYYYGITSCWNGSMFVMTGGNNNAVATSPDGLNWTGGGTIGGLNLGGDAIWDGTKFLITLYSGKLYSSTNGTSWTHVAGMDGVFSIAISKICWDGTKYIAVGNGSVNTMATSTNGTTWTGMGLGTFGTTGTGICSANAPNLYPPITKGE